MKKPYDDWVPNPDLYDSFEIVHAHKPLEQPPSPASYIIFQVGEKTYAKNGKTGQIDYSGTDAASVIQAAINATAKRIFFKQATYTINSTLTIPTTAGLRLELVGEFGTVFEHTAGTLDSMLDALATSYQQGANAQLLKIENIRFNFAPKDDNSICLDLQYIVADLDRVSVRNVGTKYIGNGIYATPIGNPFGAIWQSCFVEGFRINYRIDQEHVLGLWLLSQNAGYVAPQTSAHHFMLEGNHITLINPQALTTPNNATTAHRFGVSGNRKGRLIINPLIENDANGGYLFNLWSVGTYPLVLEVYGLHRTGYATDPKINSAANYAYVKFTDCPDIITTNKGTATFSGNGTQTQFTIAHGLAAAPSVVMLEAKSADAAGDKYWSADATNITVTFKTAPPSGSNNVILSWKAEV